MTRKRTFPIEEIACENPVVGMSLSCSEKPVWLEFRGQSRSEIEEIGKNKIIQALIKDSRGLSLGYVSALEAFGGFQAKMWHHPSFKKMTLATVERMYKGGEEEEE